MSTSRTPDGLIITASSYSVGNNIVRSIHSEHLLIYIYNLLYKTNPPTIMNWRTIADGTVREAKPCTNCANRCIEIGLEYIELYYNNTITIFSLYNEPTTLSSGDRRKIRDTITSN